MKVIGSVAALIGAGIGVYLHRSEDSKIFVFEIGSDGRWLLKGTMAVNGEPSLRFHVKEPLPPVQPGDSVLCTEVTHRQLPMNFRTWSIDRKGTSIESSSGKAPYYGAIWGLTLLPVLLWILAYAILSPLGRKGRLP